VKVGADAHLNGSPGEREVENVPTLRPRLVNEVGVIARNVDAGAVHISWCSDYAKQILANAPAHAGVVATSVDPVVGRLRCTKWEGCNAFLKHESNDGCFVAGSRGNFYRCYESPANAESEVSE
jgi:hypothetical protein